MEEWIYFSKWRSFYDANPTIDDKKIRSIRNLESKYWFVFIARQKKKSFLILIENDYSKIINESYKKVIKFENHCMNILNQHWWEVKETPNTRDQVVNLIASINYLRICI